MTSSFLSAARRRTASRDGAWREDGILNKFPPGGPAVVWRKPIGPGFSGPAVVQEDGSATLVPPDVRVDVQPSGHLVLTVAG